MYVCRNVFLKKVRVELQTSGVLTCVTSRTRRPLDKNATEAIQTKYVLPVYILHSIVLNTTVLYITPNRSSKGSQGGACVVLKLRAAISHAKFLMIRVLNARY